MQSKHWDMWVSTRIEDLTVLSLNVMPLAFAKDQKKNHVSEPSCEDLHIEV